MKFFIKKIIVSGPQKTDSIIEFSEGVNIIYGPSNTGKTYIVNCIDYMFGSEKEPIDISNGYNTIDMVVQTQNATIHLKRKIGEKKIAIHSSNPTINSGTYMTTTNRNNYEKTINSFWLSLIGIKDMHLIISNENFKKQILSWKTFRHIFFLTETKIISECSPLLSERSTSNTAVISSLVFLLSGKSYEDTETKESKEIKEAKKEAVKAYINQELFKMSDRKQVLTTQLNNFSDTDITKELETIILSIQNYEEELNNALVNNKKLLAQLHDKNEQLTECNILLNRYEKLATQYNADLKRLSFIVDGEANFQQTLSSKCPFCDGKINIKKTHNYIEAAKSDYNAIKLQTIDLDKASKELIIEKNHLEADIHLLEEQKQKTESIIESEIKPQLSFLNEKILVYKKLIEYQKELDLLNELSTKKTDDIIENDSESENEIKFKVKEKLDYTFISELSQDIKAFLEKCNYENLYSVVFDKKTMDIEINGKKKSTNGKGYNAYLNSVVAFVLSRYMEKKAKYSTDFLVLDSPILSLKENNNKKPSKTMRHSLFQNIIENCDGIQTIIIENEIPNIDYKNTNLIHFTKVENSGRYGFLIDLRD